jgi:hypothetical protein
MGSAPDTSTDGPQTSEQPAYMNLSHDFSRHGDYHYVRELFPPSRGYHDARAQGHTLESPSASSQFITPRGMVDQCSPGTAAHPVIYTDDAGLKIYDRVRRQCFNCKTTATTTWRRSMLNLGKLVRFSCSARRDKLVLKKNRRFATSVGCLSERTPFRGRRISRADGVRHLPLLTRTRTFPILIALSIVIITAIRHLCHSPVLLAPWAVKRAHRTRPG